MKKLITVLATLIMAVTLVAGEYADVSVKEVKNLVDSKKVVLIDVNGSESFAKGRVPGALNFEKIEGKLASALPADKSTPIVAYCGGPKCMAYKKAAKAAKDLGYTNVKHMSAGLSGWKESGQKLEK